LPGFPCLVKNEKVPVKTTGKKKLTKKKKTKEECNLAFEHRPFCMLSSGKTLSYAK